MEHYVAHTTRDTYTRFVGNCEPDEAPNEDQRHNLHHVPPAHSTYVHWMSQCAGTPRTQRWNHALMLAHT
jgi:hypothetical protein